MSSASNLLEVTIWGRGTLVYRSHEDDTFEDDT